MARLFHAAGAAHVERADGIAHAVKRAYRLARLALSETGATEATVLLSPAAAGIDLLAGHSVRGEQFKRAVGALVGAPA